MTTAAAPSATSPTVTAPTAPTPISSPAVDSLQPVAASPQISRTSITSTQTSPGNDSCLRCTSPSLNKSASPSPQPRHPVPSFPSQTSRLSIASTSFTLSHRDSFHPQYQSSLPYTSVRDFAYPALHPLHYGPPKAQTPAPESRRSSRYFDSGPSWYSGNAHGTTARRLSDPPYPSFGAYETSGGWGGNWYEGSYPSGKGVAGGRGAQPPPLQFEDGPPWNEDPDLHSPVVVSQSSRHRKHKSSGAHIQSSSGYSRRPSKNAVDYHESTEAGWDRGAGNTELFTSSGRNVGEPGDEYYNQEYYNGDFGEFPLSNGSLGQNNQEYYSDIDEGEEGAYSDDDEDDNHRLSRRYHFTIASEAEEMHGKAVALFDFQKENENELGLVEGQVIWVSYRHGMGWLVAEDPKTRESGLVPEEYVRLLRDIQQPIFENDNEGMTTGEDTDEYDTSHNSGMKPVISTFSTSSQDIHPYPLPLSHGEPPPRTRGGSLGSQSQTPTVGTWEERIQALEAERERALKEEEEKERAGFGKKGSAVEETNCRIGREEWSALEERQNPTNTKLQVGLGLLGAEPTKGTETISTNKINGSRAVMEVQASGKEVGRTKANPGEVSTPLANPSEVGVPNSSNISKKPR